VQRKLSQLGYAFRWRQPNIFTPNILQALYTGNRWILQDALSYFYATNSGNPSNSSFWPNEQLDAIINLFKVF
jgi:hypothetical protein